MFDGQDTPILTHCAHRSWTHISIPGNLLRLHLALHPTFKRPNVSQGAGARKQIACGRLRAKLLRRTPCEHALPAMPWTELQNDYCGPASRSLGAVFPTRINMETNASHLNQPAHEPHLRHGHWTASRLFTAGRCRPHPSRAVWALPLDTVSSEFRPDHVSKYALSTASTAWLAQPTTVSGQSEGQTL